MPDQDIEPPELAGVIGAGSLHDHAGVADPLLRLPRVEAHPRGGVADEIDGAAVERQDGTEAVTRAEGLRFSRTAPRERVGHHWIDLARAFQLHGDRDRALASLYRAKRTAPQMMRYHPQVRETLVTLAEQERRRSDSLAALASWVGVRL